MATLEQIEDFLEREFPQSPFVVDAVEPRYARLRIATDDSHLRPGGTISGPTMMAIADHALYVAILGTIGLVPLAVTTSLNINFLRKPAAGQDLLAECRLIKVGRVLIVGDVEIRSGNSEEAVAHATGTYSVPPDR